MTNPDICTQEDCPGPEAHYYGSLFCWYKRELDWEHPDENGDVEEYFRRVGSQRYVNVYEIDRAYGGPEEGGWWFDCGTPVESILCQDPDEAHEVLEERRQRYRELDEQVDYPVSSVCYRGGNYSVTWEYDFAQAYPQERPFYE